MALIFLGVTECALCGKVLQEGDEVTTLPPIADTQHSLYKYFDAGLHTQCFENWDKKEDVLRVIKEAKEKFINSDYFKEMIAKFGKPKWLDEME
jgi:hypothetical protein